MYHLTTTRFLGDGVSGPELFSSQASEVVSAFAGSVYARFPPPKFVYRGTKEWAHHFQATRTE